MSATSSLNAFCWPASKLGEAIEELAVRTRLLDKRPSMADDALSLESPEALNGDREALDQWIEAAAEWVGIEAEPLDFSYSEVEQMLRLSGPAIVRVPARGDVEFLAVAGGRRGKVVVLGPDKRLHGLGAGEVRASICRELEAPLLAGLNQLLDEAKVPERRRESVRSMMLRESLSAVTLRDCWLLRVAPQASFRRQAIKLRLPHRLAAVVVAQAIQYFLLIASWWVIGRGALEGRLDLGWLMAWALLLLTMTVFRLAVAWLQGVISIGAGALLKQRLLYGALRLDSEDIRKDGAGQLLGRVMEATAVETLALSGGFSGLTALVELVLAAFVLGAGAGGSLHVLLFCVWLGFSLLVSWRFYRRQEGWTKMRLAMTNDLVERMVGHRTRLAQQPRERWHEGEDRDLAEYIDSSRRLDSSTVLLAGLVPRGWLLVGFLGLAPSVIAEGASMGGLAVGIGGVLLAYQGLGKMVGSLSQLTGASIAWDQIAVLFKAAARPEVKGSPSEILDAKASGGGLGEKLISAHDLSFSYGERGEPVFRQCSLQVYAGDRILLEGPSGGGKSTFASLLVGLRSPDSGLLLLEGLDYRTLGARGWKARVVAAPQFHENHVMTGTLAFNLLMGDRWPPGPGGFDRAEAMMRELGLGELLDRMPSGLLQMVGETGWQLSHGERSRIYIARALLQRPRMVVLDESFAALDPESLRRALDCVLAHSSTVLVIAHP
ncbi:MAG TPA: ABC transporter ATP-binding protein [Blastocatellia bacterium]|nr:ABC transporter ATP-binding protein [Blastocatellia bacterium]